MAFNRDKEKTLWMKATHGAHRAAGVALQALVANRPNLTEFSLENAQDLVKRVLLKAWPDEAQARIHSLCLRLLAFWCQSLPTGNVAPGGSEPHKNVLSTATRAVLEIASKPDKSADLATAACLFLSCVATAMEESRVMCHSSICQALLLEAALLTKAQTSLLTDLLWSVACLCSHEQSIDIVLWEISLLLDLWSAEGAEASVSGEDAKRLLLDQMGALYSSFQAAIATILSSSDPSRRLTLLDRIAVLLEASQQRQSRKQQGAGVVAAAGTLESCVCSKKASQEVVRSLTGIVLEACRTSQQDITRKNDDEGWILQQVAAFAITQVNMACAYPWPTEFTTRCVLNALLGEVLSLDPFFQAAQRREPTAQVDSWLQQKLSGLAMRSAGRSTQYLIQHYPRATPRLQREVCDNLRERIKALHRGYTLYAQDTPHSWMEALNVSSVRQVLDKIFMTCVSLFTIIWSTSGKNDRDYIAPDILHQLALLQFSRTRLASYLALVRTALAHTASSEKASILLLKSTPPYSSLVASIGGKQGQHRWQSDPVLAAEMQFRLTLLSPCIPVLPKADVMDVALPLAYLYLAHSHTPVAAAAHNVFCAALQVAPEKEQLAPYYVRRALDSYPASTPLNSFTTGMDALAQSLPSGNPMMLYCLQSVCDRVLALLAEKDQQKAGISLVNLCGYLLLVIDFQILESALEIVRELVRQCPIDHKREVMEKVRKVVITSDDYSRKTKLARWLQSELANV